MSSDSALMSWARWGVVASVALILIKFVGYSLTGSAALLSDSLESSIHIVTSGFALFSIWLSRIPRDHNHPYGHGKIEYISAAIEGGMVIAAGLGVIIVSVARLFDQPELPRMELGALVSLVAAAVSGAVGTAMLRAGRRLGSMTLEADGLHLRTDAVTSAGAFVGLSAVWVTGWAWVDSVVAILLALHMLREGGAMARRALSGIMDETNPELLTRIAGALERRREPGWLSPHKARVQHLGAEYHIDLHLVFPRFWTLERAHEAAHDANDALVAEFGGNAEVMTHAEPCTELHCVDCDLDDCVVRFAPFAARPRWTAEVISQPDPRA